MREFLKRVAKRTLSKKLQRKVRHAYLVRSIVGGEETHEPEIEAVRALVREGDHVADLGANVGLYTRVLSELTGPTGRVFAFEPIRDNFSILTDVVRSGKLSNVQAFCLAVGREDGEQEMVVPTLDQFEGHYYAHFVSDGEEPGERETVETRTLDGLHTDGLISKLDFVKCDVEGAELGVLEGGRQVLGDHKPSMLIEISKSTSEACFELLLGWGYQGFVYDGTLQKTSGYLDGRFSNYLFLHPDRAVRIGQLGETLG